MFVTLLYHSINHRNPAKTAIAEEAFEAQLSFLLREGYSILTLAQAIDIIAGKKEEPQHAVLLTFDDGFADNVHTALPHLIAYNMTATLFLVSAYIGQKYHLNQQAHDNIRHLTWEELQLWLEAGCDIGGHTHTHLHLTHLNTFELHNAIFLNKYVLEENLHVKLRAFSYPYGEHNQWVRDVVCKYYDLAFCIDNGCWDPAVNRYAINRLEVIRDWSIGEFAEHLDRLFSDVQLRQ